MLKPFQEIMAGLAQPLPQQCISHRKAEDRKGGTGARDIPFVHYVLIMDVLDQVAGKGNWCAEPVEVYEVRGQMFQKVKLTIRAVEGEFHQYGLGWSTKEGDRFGGPVADAYATAFRRAAMQFGFERRLWDDEEQHLAKLRAHWAKGQDIAPQPVPPKKLPKKIERVSDADHAQQWHDLHTQYQDLWLELGFVPARVHRWIQRDYGDNSPQFTVRDMTNEQLAHAVDRLQHQRFGPKQLQSLRTPMEDPPPEVDPETGEILTEAAPGAAGGSV